MSTWHYYNHALVPSVAPHEEPDLSELKDKGAWKCGGGHPLFARWTSDYDCPHQTEWWYCVKDGPFDISALKAHRRYLINKGRRFFDVRLIDPCEHAEELYQVQIAAFSGYPEVYRPHVDKESFIQGLPELKKQYTVFGAFDRDTGVLQGYALLGEHEGYVNLNVQKTNPSYEKKQINAALVYGILDHYKDRLSKDYYIIDGERNIMHETAFQDYLEAYFGFRKAYCRLHIRYRGAFGLLVHILYPFRRLISKVSSLKAKQAYAVLRMEEIVRNERKDNHD